MFKEEYKWYLVQGYIRNNLEQELVVAKSARQACKRFCLEFGLSEAEDVPFLAATNVSDSEDYYEARNNGYLLWFQGNLPKALKSVKSVILTRRWHERWLSYFVPTVCNLTQFFFMHIFSILYLTLLVKWDFIFRGNFIMKYLLDLFVFVARVIIGNAYLRTALVIECKKLGIKVPRLILCRENEIKRGNNSAGIVQINIAYYTPNEWLHTLRHELRHERQRQQYKDVVDWCLSKPEYKQHGWFYLLCPIELDAELYADRKGQFNNEHGACSVFTAAQLENFYQQGVIFEIFRSLKIAFSNKKTR